MYTYCNQSVYIFLFVCYNVYMGDKLMKNYFIIHGSFGDSNEHYLPWLKKELEKEGEVIAVDFPVGKDNQNFENWSKVLDNFKNKINQETIFIGRSIAPIFIVKYLIKNNLKINKLISISGFNGFINIPDYDYVNKSFLMDSIDNFKEYANEIICIYSDNDPYVPYYLLDMFARCLANKVKVINGGGHFNADSGYGEKFEVVLKYIKEQ